MRIRLAAAGLILAATLGMAAPASAQFLFGFGSYGDLSPRQIAGILEDEGYELNGPMVRRGDVYVCDAVSVTGRSERLIVDAHRGRVIQRFAVGQRRRPDEGDSYGYRDSRGDEGQRGSDDERWSDDDRPSRHVEHYALGDPGRPDRRATQDDDDFAAPTPPARVPEAKPKPHVAKKHQEPAVGAAPSGSPGPEPSVAAVAPSAPSPRPTVEGVKPSPKPKPAVEAVKPQPSVAVVAPSAPSPKPSVEMVKPAPPVEAAKPAPTQEPVKAAEAPRKIEIDKAPAPAPEAPKPDAPRKKINDLPVGTLD
jgi:hypothetical protein